MNQSPKHLIKLLEAYGFVFKRSKGFYQINYNPITQITVIVPVHGGKDIKKGAFLAILKQAGIDKNEA
ncbi:MAG: type II toxin-antitoxin system HicA family toxin [Chitinophagaceae bacterium]|nr:type II toxin-antitoxin system HicA family toxin [Chitinophagaceae bacterium]